MPTKSFAEYYSAALIGRLTIGLSRLPLILGKADRYIVSHHMGEVHAGNNCMSERSWKLSP